MRKKLFHSKMFLLCYECRFAYMLFCKKVYLNVTLVTLSSAPLELLVKVPNQVNIAQIAQKPRSVVVTSVSAPQKHPYALCVHNCIVWLRLHKAPLQ